MWNQQRKQTYRRTLLHDVSLDFKEIEKRGFKKKSISDGSPDYPGNPGNKEDV